MKITSQKIAANTALNKITFERPTLDQLVPVGKNFIFAIDVSGSMWGELPLIRQQLKNKIPTLVQPEDTISIIWFSGSNQAGILQEGVRVNNVLDLQKLNDAIDRFLQPVGLTAFLPPLELTEQVISRLKGNGNPFSFTFLSDGYNNASVWSKVITKAKELDGVVAAATFVEYGYYADSKALTQLAELMGGEKIFAKDFEAYDAEFVKIINKDAGKKTPVDISSLKGKIKHGLFFAFDAVTQTISTFSAGEEGEDKDSILIPSSIEELYFLSRYKVDTEETDLGTQAALVAAYLAADRLKYNTVEDLLLSVGDVDLLKEFTGAYGKQKLNELKTHIKDYALIPNLLYANGKQANYRIDPNQFCMMDLIRVLQEGNNKIYPFHPTFKYNYTSAKTVTKVELTEEAKEKLAKATTAAAVAQIASSIESPEFIYPEGIALRGSSFDTLTWNESRANLSVLVQVFGNVKLPKNDFDLNEVPSHIYRNFTLIKDGIANVDILPVTLDESTFTLLNKEGLIKGNTGDVALTGDNVYQNIVLLDISSLPIINRSMAVNISGKKLAELQATLIQTQLGHKYIKNLKSIYDPKSNTESAKRYSEEAATWLQSIGVTDYNGFSPKKEKIESTDFYVAPVLEVKIQNTSTSPTVKKVFEKIDEQLAVAKKIAAGEKVKAPKDLNLMESIMKAEIDSISPNIYVNGKFDYETRDSHPIIVEELNRMTQLYNARRRQLLTDIAQIKFGIILSRTWFTEFSSMEENELVVDLFDQPLKVKFVFSEEEIAL